MQTSPRLQPEQTQVLIVDDEPRMQRMLTASVRELGFPSTAAGSARQAMRATQQAPAAIVILDLNLPDEDGLSLLEQIRRTSPDTQAIILTGFGDLQAAQRALRLDAVDFLTKPCQLAELEQALERAWRRHAQARTDDAPEADLFGQPDVPQDARLEEVERKHILETLAQHDGDRDATARALGISVRTLYYRIAQYRQTDEPG